MKEERKSISKGITFSKDISDSIVLEQELLKLTSEISHELRIKKLKANVIQIVLKDDNFISSSRQKKVEETNLYDDMSRNVIELFRDNFVEGTKLRYVCVGVNNLKSEDEDEQLNIFSIVEEEKNIEVVKQSKKKAEVAKAMDKLKEKFGDKIDYASVIKSKK